MQPRTTRHDKTARVKAETKHAVKAEPPEVKPTGPQTDKHSPIFLDLGDEPKKAP